MSLQLVVGSSGSGKSTFLYTNIIEESIKNEQCNYFVIVPEQFTMETQKDLVKMHPRKGIMNIDILSFMRLAYRVFEEVGKEQKPVLEDTGKNMLLRKVLDRKKEELVIFREQGKKQGFISEMKSLLSELLQYSIDREQLQEMIQKLDKKPLLQQKLRDMLVIYDGFEELMEEKYITAEEILDVLDSVIEKSERLKNSVICFDGFTGFTPSQYKLLSKLMKLCKKVLVTVTIDPRENMIKIEEEFRLFHLSKKTIKKLYDIANEERIVIEPAVVMNEKIPYRFKDSKALAAMEHNLFRYPNEIFLEEQEDIHIYSAKNPEGEVAFTLTRIQQFVQEQSYRYREIAVVTGDMEQYAKLFERECKRSEIPYFVDYKKDIMSNPMVEWLLALLELFQKDFTYESMFRYLRCGLIDIEKESVDRLENYVLALGIRGWSKWKKQWTRAYGKEVSLDLDRINEIRNNVVEPLQNIRKQMKKKDTTVVEYTKVLFSFMESQNIYWKLKQYEMKFEQENQLDLAKEYSQVYEIVLELFDQCVELLGDEVVTLKEYMDLLESGLAEAKVGVIPPSLDQIVIGDIERTRLKDIRVLFFLGVNDGVIPKNGTKGGIISDMERETLAGYDIELSPTRRQSAYTEQFYLYLNLTKPQNKLYLTYHKADQNGTAKAPSYLIGRLRKMFPKLQIEEEFSYMPKEELGLHQEDDMLGNDRGHNYLLEGIREYEPENMADWWKELYHYYLSKKEFQKEMEFLITGACSKNESSDLGREVARALYGSNLNNSVSRVEKYAACAFAHFLAYGLQLREREKYEIGAVDFGTIFHNAIELFSNRLRETGKSWKLFSVEEEGVLIEECVEAVTNEYGNTILQSSNRNAYMIERMKRMTRRTIWALCEHIRQGKFEPKNYEAGFSYLDGIQCVKVPLSDDAMMHLQGRIDRIDTYEEDDKLYVKIIDYKTGATKFQLEDFYYGLQMQLVVYLDVALEKEQKKHPDKTIVPAGIFYYHISDPVVEGKMEQEEREKALLKELKMNGLVNSDTSVLQFLDQHFGHEKGQLEASVTSEVIPVETTKDGNLGKRSKVADTERFQGMIKYVEKKMKAYGDEILNGNTEINPYQLKEKTACDYCQFHGVCGFDKKLSSYQYRKLRHLENEEIWELLEDGEEK